MLIQMSGNRSSHDLLAAFNIQRNDVVSFVGAGGKKTAISALAAANIGSVGITTTVRTLIPAGDFSLIIESNYGELIDSLESQLQERQQVVFASELESEVKIRGYSSEFIDRVVNNNLFDLLLVKADGALKKLLKAAAEYEPQIPNASTKVVIVVPVSIVGVRLTEEHVHRLELVASIMNLPIGGIIEPEHVARLIAADHGYLKDIPHNAEIILLLNHVDDEELFDIGVKIADLVVKLTPRMNRVVFARMIIPEIIDVFEN
jgi:probable selenium-dependent hydroxylase accessory protein YqeC